MRSKLASTRLVGFLTSLKITVGCLIALFILVLVGTLYQTALWRDMATISQNPDSNIPLFLSQSAAWAAVFDGNWGLYSSQQKFFNSWMVSFGDVPVFPGGRLILWVFFVNLAATMLFKLRYTWGRIGITVLHGGLVLFFLNSFLTFHLAENTLMSLYERESSTVSWGAGEWELAVMKVEDDDARVTRESSAYETVGLKVGQTLSYDNANVRVMVNTYYPHAAALGTIGNITGFEKLTPEPQYERNEPGLELTIQSADGPAQKVRLWGLILKPVPIEGKDGWFIALQRRRMELPFELQLEDVSQELHQGTGIAKSYASRVLVKDGAAPRTIDITMNHPLRHGPLTIFQQGYQVDQNGYELSTFAVVHNPARHLPLIACIVTCAGLFIHFCLMFDRFMKRRRKEAHA